MRLVKMTDHMVNLPNPGHRIEQRLVADGGRKRGVMISESLNQSQAVLNGVTPPYALV
jgi:hypothetical protein